MNVPVRMPQSGLTMTEGEVIQWLKSPGDSVKKGDSLLTITTDKVEMEIESPADGILESILVEVGTVVPVGTVLAYLERPETE